MGEIEEREINLIHLFLIIIKKWKQIFLFAIIVALVLGSYNYIKRKPKLQNLDENLLLYKEQSLVKFQTYLNNSILIKNYSLLFRKYSIQFDIVVKNENVKYLMQLFESYVKAIQSEELYALVANEIGENNQYIYELINITRMNNDGNYQMLKDDYHGNITLSFIVNLLGPNDNYAAKIANVVMGYVENQEDKIKDSVGPHIVNYYYGGSDLEGNFISSRVELEKNIDKLTRETKILKNAYIKTSNSYKKWTFIGFFIGAFLMVGVYVLLYIFSDKLHEGVEIESLFGIKTWNKKQLQNKKIKEILVAIVMSRKDDYKKVLVTGSFITKDFKTIVEEINKDIKNDLFYIYEDVINNPNAIQALSTSNAVLITESIEKSRISEISREVKFIKQNNLPIIGCVIEE